MGDQPLMQMAGELRDAVGPRVVPEEVAGHADLSARAGARNTALSSQGHSSIASSREGCRRKSGTGTTTTPECVPLPVRGPGVTTPADSGQPGAGKGCSAPGNVQELHQQHASVGSMDGHQARPGGLRHARSLALHLLCRSQNPHPAAGHEVLVPSLEGLQPPMPVAAALVVEVEPATSGICSLSPDLIDHKIADRQPVLRGGIDGVAIQHQRVARVVAVACNDQTWTDRPAPVGKAPGCPQVHVAGSHP
jgi:hypothetical protein